MKATVDIVTINPAQAEKILVNIFPDQRPPTENHINRMAIEMKNGTWRLSSDALVRIKGKLANGQNRLHAVVRSKTVQKFLMMDTDDDELYKVLDCGRKRTVADVLRGEYALQVASAARTVVLYDLGALTTGSGGAGSGKAGDKCTRSLCVEFAQDNHAQLLALVSACTSMAARNKIVPVSAAAAVSFIAKRDCKGVDAAVDQFMQNVYDGCSQDDAARDFRERMIRARLGTAQLPRFHVLALLIKSLKSYLNGTRLAVVRINDGEAYPRLK